MADVELGFEDKELNFRDEELGCDPVVLVNKGVNQVNFHWQG